nr:hypothetical protein CFP56_53728 [Quercus suber]
MAAGIKLFSAPTSSKLPQATASSAVASYDSQLQLIECGVHSLDSDSTTATTDHNPSSLDLDFHVQSLAVFRDQLTRITLGGIPVYLWVLRNNCSGCDIIKRSRSYSLPGNKRPAWTPSFKTSNSADIHS